jgi:hypothetical protein
MPSANPSQRIAEISKELEIPSAQTPINPDISDEMLKDCLGEILDNLKGPNMLAGGA